jgi:hypothetical protein
MSAKLNKLCILVLLFLCSGQLSFGAGNVTPFSKDILSASEQGKLNDLAGEYVTCAVIYSIMAQCSDSPDLKGSKKIVTTLRMLVDQSNGIAYSYFVSVLGGRSEALLALEKSITEQTSKEINKSCINLPLLNDSYLSCNGLIENPQEALAERLPGKFQAGP